MLKNIILFDIDGTISEPRQKVEQKMLDILCKLKIKYTIGCIGGSDYDKAVQQVGKNILNTFDYAFFENGLIAYKNTKLIGCESITKYLGEDKIKTIVNFVLHYIADLELPIKRGTFIEYRNGMINISPIGRNCSYDERIEFEKYDKKHKIRETMIEKMKQKFSDYNLSYSIGGMISFDLFPVGWDKTYCLKFLDDFDQIYFFGDKTEPGGNDYEIFSSNLVYGYKTTGVEKTIELLNDLFDI